MAAAIRLQRLVDVGTLIPGEGPLAVAADIFIPPRCALPAVLLCCLPGGGLGRGYYDLNADEGARTQGDLRTSGGAGLHAGLEDFSFASHMTSHGFLVVTIDPVGVGGSCRPRNGFALTADVLAAANACAVERIRFGLIAGTLTRELPPSPGLRTIGVGHSMGAMLTVMQQACDPRHVALLLMGFGTGGLPGSLSIEEAELADDPVRTRQNLVRLAQARSNEPYPEIVPSSEARALFAGENAQRRAVEALKKVRTRLLVTAGLFSMIPGSSAPECARVDVPILLAVGDRDIAGPPHQLPASFPASPEITVLVLRDTGHCHFLFPSRRHLFARVAEWIHSVLRG